MASLLIFKNCRKIKSYKSQIKKIKRDIISIDSKNNKSLILDIYKSYIMYISSIQNKRWKQHLIFVTLLTGIFAVSEKIFPCKIIIQCILSVCAIIVSIFWILITCYNKTEMDIKFDILKLLEIHLPTKVFKYEYELSKRARHITNNTLEWILSMMFFLFYIFYLFFKLYILHNTIK